MAKKPKDNSPVEIWLSPACECDNFIRDWHDFEPPPCPDCGMPPTRYVRPGLPLKREKTQ